MRRVVITASESLPPTASAKMLLVGCLNGKSASTNPLFRRDRPSGQDRGRGADFDVTPFVPAAHRKSMKSCRGPCAFCRRGSGTLACRFGLELGREDPARSAFVMGRGWCGRSARVDAGPDGVVRQRSRLETKRLGQQGAGRSFRCGS